MEECIVCFEERELIAFPCAHKVCVVCYPKLKRCPLCNYEVVVFVPNTPTHVIELRQLRQLRQSDRDSRILQFVFCFILVGIIVLSVYNFH
jgi:hypothetical protein